MIRTRLDIDSVQTYVLWTLTQDHCDVIKDKLERLLNAVDLDKACEEGMKLECDQMEEHYIVILGDVEYMGDILISVRNLQPFTRVSLTNF